MAQTMNFLTENNLLAYDDLEKKAQVATDTFNLFSGEINSLKSVWQK